MPKKQLARSADRPSSGALETIDRLGRKVRKDSDTGRILEAAKRMLAANTESPGIARQKLQSIGILDRHGRLSKNYK
jgi:hypothetical protein